MDSKKTLSLFILLFFAHSALANQCVIFVHGLGRTSQSLEYMKREFNKEGYQVVNKDYPSTSYKVEKLSSTYIPKWLGICKGSDKIHFVTHSLGGIMVRYYLKTFGLPENLGNVLMMGPPNHGSELVDNIGSISGPFLGPANAQLGTGKDSLPNTLGPANFSVGIIAGNKTANPLTHIFFDKENDGKVTVESSKLEGMADHIVLPVTHTFMMESPEVLKQAQSFIYKKSFIR
jgi:hypothetical protein